MRGLLIVLFLTGCATTGSDHILRGSGVETMPPPGYQKLCSDTPDFEACTP